MYASMRHLGDKLGLLASSPHIIDSGETHFQLPVLALGANDMPVSKAGMLRASPEMID